MTLPGGQHNQGNTTEHGVVKASVFWRGGGGALAFRQHDKLQCITIF